MYRYIVQRLIMIIPILILVSIAIFLLLSLSPNDPAVLILGANASDLELDMFRAQHGLDKPLHVQYLNYMLGLLHGDMGESYSTMQDVSYMIKIRIGNTMILCAGACVLITILGVLLGVSMALRQNSIYDNIARVCVLIFSAMPQFWLGMMLILLLAVQWGILPPQGFSTVRHMILPWICTAMGGITVVSRTTRSSMLEVVHQDYIRTARAKGLKESYIVRKHALKNSLLPIITVLGRYVGASFGGAVVIENVFQINGIGNMMVTGLRQKDIPLVMGCVMISALLIAVVNLLTDIAYAYVDPRIKSQYEGKKKKKKSKAKEVSEA
ncbi:MAG: ABC transporter permease [Firmicutes bacterium]|nr:ABC transporter permease [Bacillota bacterium]